jgi:hypothetical protein
MHSGLNRLLLLLILGFHAEDCFCQKIPGSKSHELYIGVGIHRSFFSRSDIHLSSSVQPGFDFTLNNVRGKDDEGFNFRNGAPQYNYVIGYYSHKHNWGIEFGFDHIKYYARQNQPVHIQGHISNEYFNTDTLLVPSFVTFEHSDGANYALFKFLKRLAITANRKNNHALQVVLKGGAGPVIPKTNSTIMGRHRDDRYNIAGYVIAIETGLHYPFARFLFAEAGAKGVYANYKTILIANGKGSQAWFGLHFHLLVGASLPW